MVAGSSQGSCRRHRHEAQEQDEALARLTSCCRLAKNQILSVRQRVQRSRTMLVVEASEKWNIHDVRWISPPIACRSHTDRCDGQARPVASTACPGCGLFPFSSSCGRVHLKTCKGVAPATVSISRKQKPGATLLASAKGVKAINVAFEASEAARAVRSEFTLPGTTAMRRTHGKSTPPPPASMPAIPEDVRTTSTQASWEEPAPRAPVGAASSSGQHNFVEFSTTVEALPTPFTWESLRHQHLHVQRARQPLCFKRQLSLCLPSFQMRDPEMTALISRPDKFVHACQDRRLQLENCAMLVLSLEKPTFRECHVELGPCWPQKSAQSCSAPQASKIRPDRQARSGTLAF